MTDMITVSRKEIEKLLTQLNITHQDIRALLEKAEVSEPVGYKVTGKLGERCSFKSSEVKKGDIIYTSPPDQSAKIAELEAEVSRLNAIIDDIKTLDNVFGVDDKKITSGMVLRAQTAPSISDVIDEYKKDAERYRWLKERDLDTINNGGVFAGMTPHNLVLNGYDLDEAIDLAMKATNDK